MTSLFNKDKIQYFLFTLSIIVFRYYWALISQWREDQSTNLWIAYTSEINQIPVGLLSSKDIATPNFIILIGKIHRRCCVIKVWAGSRRTPSTSWGYYKKQKIELKSNKKRPLACFLLAPAHVSRVAGDTGVGKVD